MMNTMNIILSDIYRITLNSYSVHDTHAQFTLLMCASNHSTQSQQNHTSA